MRVLGVFLLVVALVLCGFALFFPAQFSALGPTGWAGLAALLAMGLMLGAGALAMGARANNGPGLGRLLFYLLIWIGLLGLIILAYRAFGPGVESRAIIGA